MEKPNLQEQEKAAAEKAAAEKAKKKLSESTSTGDEPSTGEPSPLDERLKSLEEHNVAMQKQLASISSMLSALTSFTTPAPAAGVSPTAEVQSGAVTSPPASAAGGNGAAPAQPNPLMMMLFQKMMGGGGGEVTKLEGLAYKSLESDIQLKNTIINTLLRKGMRTQPLFEPVAEGGYHE